MYFVLCNLMLLTIQLLFKIIQFSFIFISIVKPKSSCIAFLLVILLSTFQTNEKQTEEI